MPADNEWHLYEWNLEDPDAWQDWWRRAGLTHADEFTIDSIQIQNSLGINAVIYLDEIAHDPHRSLVWLHATGDSEPDGDVDLVDFSRFAEHWLLHDADPGFESLYDLSTPADGSIDLADLAAFIHNWLGPVN